MAEVVDVTELKMITDGPPFLVRREPMRNVNKEVVEGHHRLLNRLREDLLDLLDTFVHHLSAVTGYRRDIRSNGQPIPESTPNDT